MNHTLLITPHSRGTSFKAKIRQLKLRSNSWLEIFFCKSSLLQKTEFIQDNITETAKLGFGLYELITKNLFINIVGVTTVTEWLVQLSII